MNNNSFVGKIVSVALLISAVIVLDPSVSTGLDEKPKFVEYVSSGKYFKCNIPAGWSVYKPGFGLSAEEKKIYGVTLVGPQNGSPFPPEISIHYYAPGNLMDNMDKYVRIHSITDVGSAEKGQPYGEVRQMTIAGREAMVFEVIDIRSIKKRTINSPKHSIYEKYIVLPAMMEDGYYALKLSVFNERKDKYTGIFEESVRSFLPDR